MPGKRKALISIGIIAALPCLFFIWYTLRVFYLYFTLAADDPHRTGGMMIGAVAFPVAAIFFGTLSIICIRSGGRSL